MITKKTKYALKALQYLAQQPEGQPVLIADLSKNEQIPRKFLEFILLTLRKTGILQSRIGKGGGYWLALPPAKISLSDIIQSLEGDVAPVQCLGSGSGTSGGFRCEECIDMTSCGTRLVMIDVDLALREVLQRLTLADIIERSADARLRASKTVDFSI